MILQLAWRNIWRNPVRSLVIIISVAAGLFAALAVLALYDGMMISRLRTVIDTETGHLQVHDPGFKDDMEPRYVIKNQARWAILLDKDPAIKCWSSRVVSSGMLATPSGSAGVQVNGINSGKEMPVSGIYGKLLRGLGNSSEQVAVSSKQSRSVDTGLGLTDGRSILIGRKLATKLKLSLGNKVVLTMTDKDANMVSSAMRIRGIYESANTPLDELNVYVSEKELAETLGVPGSIHELAIILKSDDSVSAVQHRYSSLFPGDRVESWKELSPETNLMIDTVDLYSYIIVIIILIALSFGIVNTMLMSVLERRKEIGMMAALGIGKKRLLLMVLTETIFLSLVGVPIALGIGWLAVSYYHKNGLDLSGMGEELMKSFGYESLIYPTYPSDKIPAIILLVLISAILASIFPSLKSVNIKPAEALQK
ncbi:MAG TPA: FtsX-like permease family protein [Chitinophagaceae bacterium]|nr:FtsX-like permease family protein [Chitinophagaceae bacterium]